MVVGYTTGVFDLLHIGHLNIIKRAKSQCDKLIVGVSTDELVAQYKHQITHIPYEDRIEIIRSIKYVDEAVAQTTMDKLEAWQRLRFHILFVGEDQGTWKQYERTFLDLNIQIVVLPRTPHISTTDRKTWLASNYDIK